MTKSNYQQSKERKRKQKKFVWGIGWTIITIFGVGGLYYIYLLINL